MLLRATVINNESHDLGKRPPSMDTSPGSKSWHQFVPPEESEISIEISSPSCQVSDVGRNLDLDLAVVSWNIDADRSYLLLYSWLIEV